MKALQHSLRQNTSKPQATLQQQKPLLNLVFLTFTFPELKMRYIRTRPLLWHLQFFATLQSFQLAFLYLRYFPVSFLSDPYSLPRNTSVVVFGTYVAETTNLAQRSSRNGCLYPTFSTTSSGAFLRTSFFVHFNSERTVYSELSKCDSNSVSSIDL